MKILDRHIAVRYAVNVLILFFILNVFVVAVDVFLSLKKYLAVAGESAPEGASTFSLVLGAARAIASLWGPRVLQLFSYLAGVALIAGLGFTCSQFVRQREFVAMLAAGVSLQRIAAPFVAVAALVLALSAINQEFFLPRVAHLLPRDHSEALQQQMDSFTVSLISDGAGRLYYAASFDPRRDEMADVYIWERDETGTTTRQITAERAVWSETQSAWTLENAFAHAPESPGSRVPVMRIETDLDPTAVTALRVQGFAESLSWRQLSSILAASRAPVDDNMRSRLERIRWGRLSNLLGTLLSLVITLPFFLQRMPTNMVAQSLKAAPLGGAALVGSALGAATPAPGLPIWLGVSIAPLVALPLALWAIGAIRS